MTATTLHETAAERRDGVSFTRLLWVAPLTVDVALVVNLAIKTLLQAIDPSLTEMGQLGRPLIILTLEGAILAVIVFRLAGLAGAAPDPLVSHRGRDRTPDQPHPRSAARPWGGICGGADPRW